MLFESLNNLVLSAIVFLLGGALCTAVGRSIGLKAIPAILLYVWHSAWAVSYSSYILVNGGDAFNYFERARFDFVEPTFGTEFVVWLTSFPASIGLGFWPISFIYNIAGALGLVLFCAALQEITSEIGKSLLKRLLILLCLALPSLSFWTSGIGKDSLAFLSVGLFLWSTINFGRRQVGAIGAVICMLMIRPHIACLMVLSIAAGALFVSNVRASVRFGVGALATAAALFAVPLALLYSGSAQFSSLREFISDRQEQNMGGGSSIDITGMNPLLRLLSFLYRPLPNETAGFSQLAASMDNLVLIGLTVVGLLMIYRAGFIRVFRRYSIALIYGLSCLVLLSQVTANLGLATRQKWMSIPALLIIFIGAWSMKRGERRARTHKVHGLSGAPQAVS
jgi:hypothetical protein